jgi:transcriptional regulator with XRE-family HTH domain
MTASTTEETMAPEGSRQYRLNVPVIRFAMRIAGWSQAELARRVEIHESWMSRALHGEPVSEDVARRVVAAFGGRLQLEEVVLIEGFSPELPPGVQDDTT